MPATLNLYQIRSATYHSLFESYLNTTGTPVVGIRRKGDQLQRAGMYTFTFTSVVAQTSATVLIGTDDPHNPSRDAVGKAIALDGTTWHSDIIEGLEFQFSNSASFTDAWEARVYYGSYYDSGDATEQSVLSEGIVEAGDTVGPDRVAVRNDGADLAASCEVRVVNGVRFTNDTGTAFSSINYTEKSQTANFSPGYAITFANLAASAIDVLIDATGYEVTRLDTGATFPGGAGVPLDIDCEWTAGPLDGLRFKLSASTVNAWTSTIFVSDGARLVEIAPDVSGAPGTYQDGTTLLVLTEDGGPDVGEIAAGNTAFFWQRIVSLGTDQPAGNQRHWRYLIRGLGV